MVRGVGLRHLLPVTFTTAYVILVWTGYPEDHARHLRAERGEYELFSDIPPVKPIVWAMGMNLPAAAAALPGVILLDKFAPVAAYYGGYFLTGSITPAFWFLFGGWLDRKIGFQPRGVTVKRSYVKCFLFVVGSASLALLALLLLVALFRSPTTYQQIAVCFPLFWAAMGSFYCFDRSRVC